MQRSIFTLCTKFWFLKFELIDGVAYLKLQIKEISKMQFVDKVIKCKLELKKTWSKTWFISFKNYVHFFSEALILRVHTHFFANFSDCFLKGNELLLLFFSLDNFSENASPSTFLRKSRVNWQKGLIHYSENIVSQNKICLLLQ